MDTPRRWQLAAALSAATGLGLGGLLVGNQPSEAVPSIELEAPSPLPEPVRDRHDTHGDVDDVPEIVSPTVRSLSTPDEPANTTAEAPPDGAARTQPTAPASTDSPESVDSNSSIESDE